MFQLEQEATTDLGPCECCGSLSRLVAGLVYLDGEPCAAYQVHWTPGKIEKHGAGFYVILGKWGEDTTSADRFAVALRYRADSRATGFMIVDADKTSIASNPLVGRTLDRENVIDTPLAQEVFHLIDFIWLHDDRISEITNPVPDLQ